MEDLKMFDLKEAVINGTMTIWSDGECILGSESPSEDIEYFFEGHDYYLLNEENGISQIFENGEYQYLTAKEM